MKVLVTGVSGFIGGQLTRHLLDQGHDVRGASRWLDSPFPRAERYDHVTVEDPSSPRAWKPAVSGVDAVVHLIAKTSPPEKDDAAEAEELRRVNVGLTKTLFEASWKAGVKRFVYMSCMNAVGEETGPGEVFAEDTPCNPTDPVGITKREAEEMILKYRGKMATAVLRAPMVYGPGVGGDFLRLVEEVRKRTPLPLSGVKNARSLAFVGNLTAAVAKIMEGERPSGIYHVSDGEKPSTPELIGLMASAMGTKARLFYAPPSLVGKIAGLSGWGETFRELTRSMVVSHKRLEKELGFKPPYSLKKGLELTFRKGKVIEH